MSDNFCLAVQRIRKDWSIPDATVMLYSKDKLLPVGYQCEPKKAGNDNEAKP